MRFAPVSLGPKGGRRALAHRNALGFCTKSLDALAALSGCCAATVRKATEELTDAGYITAARTYRYLPRKRKVVYGRKVYQVSLRFQGGYTLIPREILAQKEELTPAAFLVCLCLAVAAGNRRRAYPSISRIERMVGIARSTVCRALLQIKLLPGILVLLCQKRNGSFAASSYHFTTILKTAVVSGEPELLTEQGAAKKDMRGIRNILHDFILTARAALHNLLLGRGEGGGGFLREAAPAGGRSLAPPSPLCLRSLPG